MRKEQCPGMGGRILVSTQPLYGPMVMVMVMEDPV